MNCMKCGREIALGQAFCKDCLEDMSHYPVNPGTPVQIPIQPTAVPGRRNTHTKKAKKPEEQVIQLRKLVRLQCIAMLLLLLMLLSLGIYSFRKLYHPAQPVRPGENYITTEVGSATIPTVPQ